MEQQKILIATTNRGKFHEMKTFLDDLPFEFISLDDLKHKPKEPEENEGTNVQTGPEVKEPAGST